MQIRAINSINLNPKTLIKKSSNKNNNFTSNINFNGGIIKDYFAEPTYFDSIKHFALAKSEDILQKADKIKLSAQDVQKDAQAKFQDAKDLITFGQEQYFKEYKDEINGIHIDFDSFDEDDDTIDTLNEYDKNGNIIRKTIFDENLTPIAICEFTPGKKEYNEYSFENGVENLIYFEGIELFDGENFKTAKRYKFSNGNIEQYEEKMVQYLSIKKTSEIFNFDNNAQLKSFRSSYTNFNALKEEIFEFENGKLDSYSKNSNALPYTSNPRLNMGIKFKN